MTVLSGWLGSLWRRLAVPKGWEHQAPCLAAPHFCMLVAAGSGHGASWAWFLHSEVLHCPVPLLCWEVTACTDGPLVLWKKKATHMAKRKWWKACPAQGWSGPGMTKPGCSPGRRRKGKEAQCSGAPYLGVMGAEKPQGWTQEPREELSEV